MSFPETAEIYLLNNLDPGFVYPEELQYMSSREVKSSVCLDINAHLNVSITRPSVPAIVDPSNPTAVTPNAQAPQNNDGVLDKPLRAHTCHSEQHQGNLLGGDFENGGISSDQGFDVSKISTGEFSLPFFNVCMEVENTESSSGLILRVCDNNPKQQFVFEDDGKIKPVNDLSLCLTASGDYREGGGGSPVHLIRDLSLSACDTSFSTRQVWGLRSVN